MWCAIQAVAITENEIRNATYWELCSASASPRCWGSAASGTGSSSANSVSMMAMTASEKKSMRSRPWVFDATTPLFVSGGEGRDEFVGQAFQTGRVGGGPQDG